LLTDAYLAQEVLQQRAETEADAEGAFEPNFCVMNESAVDAENAHADRCEEQDGMGGE
jgi:hypothetical protein